MCTNTAPTVVPAAPTAAPAVRPSAEAIAAPAPVAPAVEPAPSPTPAQVVTPPRRPWTVLVYMAGDNGRVFNTQAGPLQLMAEMRLAGYQDLLEMGQVGTTPNVAVACLFDTPAATYQIEVRRGQGFADSLVIPMAAVNTGDPETLRRFVVEAMRAYPADHTALVIWNHGTGWLDVDVYAVTRALGDEGRSHDPIFRTTPRRMTGGTNTRPIAYDDSSKDFLDTQDLRQALTGAAADTGVRLDLIGMDACLMAMVEGARELTPFADYFVASQEVEPMAGWPYGKILALLDTRPATTPVELASAIVDEFARSYGGATRAETTVTQSAISLADTAATESLCRRLVAAILATGTPVLRRLVLDVARRQTLGFQDKNYRDLGDFAGRLASALEWENYPPVLAAAIALRNHLQGRGAGAPVLKVGYLAAYVRATGLSVYLPSDRRNLSIYQHLSFAQAAGWAGLLEWLLP